MPIVCQALITDRCWRTLFWRLRLNLAFFFPLLAVLSCDRFLLQFYFRFVCGAQLLAKKDCDMEQAIPAVLQVEMYFFQWWRWCVYGGVILDNTEESYWGIWRGFLWFGLAFKLSWIVLLNSLKRKSTLACRKSRFWVSVDVRALRPKNAYLPIHRYRNVCVCVAVPLKTISDSIHMTLTFSLSSPEGRRPSAYDLRFHQSPCNQNSTW